jgi:hypothetical protein
MLTTPQYDCHLRVRPCFLACNSLMLTDKWEAGNNI